MPRARPRKAKRIDRTTTVIYVRVPRALHERLRALVETRGYPHNLTSVASEALARGLDDLAPPTVTHDQEQTP